MRLALGVEYDGSGFSGWQSQLQQRTVQGVVEQALSKVANHPVRIACAGRTDAGVHAAGQVVHFDTRAQRTERSWVLGANASLPSDVAILWARLVTSSFHARFSALRRRYRYVIFNRAVRPAFLAQRVTWEYRPLDEQLMRAAAGHLVGEHDFNAYRAVACQASSPVRTVYRLDISRQGEMLYIDIEANGFLHHMVRNIAGVLMTIGSGEQPPDWASEVLETCNRKLGGVTAAPCGLYLLRVSYPDPFGIPSPPLSLHL